MATLLAVPVTDATTHLLSSSRESTKRKSSETVMSKPVGQALSPNSPDTAVLGSPSSSASTTNTDLNDHPMDSNGNGSNSNLAGFRIPKIKRVSPPTSSSSSAASESISTSMQPTMANDEAQNRAGKRKFSLSQYKEHKRLRSTEPMDPSLGDVDMRIQPKPPSPSVINNDTTVPSTNAQGLSPKAIEISQIAAKKSNLSEPGAKKTLKKKVIWADEKQQALVQTSFFEIDETERAHMHRFARDNMNSVPIAKLEQLLERDLRQHPNGPDRDDRSALPPLPPLIPILLPSSIPRPTVNSRQRIIQGEREQTVLQALFIRSLLPENPREPDGDSTDTSTTETILIPLEHDSADHSTAEVAPVVNSTNEKPAPIVSTNANESPNVTSTSLFPEVAQILAAAREKATSAMINAQPPTLPPPVVNPPLTLPTINNPALPFQITPNILSLLFNGAQGPVVPTPPPVNPLANLLSNIPFPLNLNPPPSNSSVNPLLTNPFNMSLPTTNNQQPSPLTFNPLSAASQVVSTSTSAPSTTTPNTTTTATTASSNGSPTYFDHSRNQKPFRFNHHNNGNNNNNNNGNNNNNNNTDHHRHNQKSFSNPRGHHFRPGQNHHNRHKQFHNRNGFS